MGNLMRVQEKLNSQWKGLQLQWRGVREVWRDSVRDYFERETWQDFERVVPAVLRELQSLDAVITQAQREVP